MQHAMAWIAEALSSSRRTADACSRARRRWRPSRPPPAPPPARPGGGGCERLSLYAGLHRLAVDHCRVDRSKWVTALDCWKPDCSIKESISWERWLRRARLAAASASLCACMRGGELMVGAGGGGACGELTAGVPGGGSLGGEAPLPLVPGGVVGRGEGGGGGFLALPLRADEGCGRRRADVVMAVSQPRLHLHQKPYTESASGLAMHANLF